MRKIRPSLLLSAAFVICAGIPSHAATSALSGIVSSAKEGQMEGVLVTAHKDGSPMSVTVVSDENGHYAFPADRLEPGHYTIKIRALGYFLAGPREVEVSPTGTTADVTLKATTNIAAQLTNADWLNSAPGTEQEKREFVACATCHTLSRPLTSTYTKEQFTHDIIPLMATMASQAFPRLVQKRAEARNVASTFGGLDSLAGYIASINLSSSPTWKYQLNGAPRPHGESTHVIITSYELPDKDMQPHDSVMGPDGYVWISNFGQNTLSRLDPKTGAVKVFHYAPTRPGYSNGNLDVEFDKAGNIWLGMMDQTGAAMFDRNTEKFTFYPVPKDMQDLKTQQAMVSPVNWQVDGKVWINSAEEPMVGRFDVKTGKYENWMHPFKEAPKGQRHSAYGIYTDSHNNAYLCDFPSQYIWKIDAKTGKATAYKTPTDFSRPRRGRMDSQDRLWFAEWRADKVGMFDTKTGEFMEWKVPGKYGSPYDADVDKTGWIWTDNMMNDLVTRIDTKTGKTVQYLLPIETNGRRIAIDEYGAKPSLWIGANHQATVMHVEPTD